MFTKLITAFFITALGFFVFDLSNSAFTESAGSPGGYTDSPGDTKHCGNASCHNVAPLVITTGITSDIPAGGWIADSTYTITLTAINAIKVKFGFELACENGSGTKIGTFAPTNPQTKLVGSNITHSSSGTSGAGTKQWQVTWAAPSAPGAGTLTFYAAFNATDNMGTKTNDIISTTTMVANENPISAIKERNALKLHTFPNPVSDQLNIESNGTGEDVTIVLYDLDGREVQSLYAGPLYNKMAVDIAPTVATGLYTVLLTSEKGHSSTKIVVSR